MTSSRSTPLQECHKCHHLLEDCRCPGSSDANRQARDALLNVSVHSAHLPDAPRELLIKLLAKCGRIARDAIASLPSEKQAIPEDMVLVSRKAMEDLFKAAAQRPAVGEEKPK